MSIVKTVLTIVWMSTLLAPASVTAQQPPSRQPPIEIDFDMSDIPEPKERKVSEAYRLLDAGFVQQTKRFFDIPRHVRKKPALNVNSVDQVPDSSWFTNRMGRQVLSVEQLRRGPNTSDGPDSTEPWTILDGKNVGRAPGLLIQDTRGQRFFLKFDLREFPELASGAEVIATKLYYASGYNTPENYIVRFQPERLQIGPKATVIDGLTGRRTMTPDDLKELLAKVAHLPDGRIRALASEFLPGKPKGPFRWHGLREDDPNDWIPHEHRRDLRGLRVIASWFSDTDRKESNSLDMYVSEQERRFLRHYLIDFGSSLGSGSTTPKPDREGFEYKMDGGEILKSVAAMGFYQAPWVNRQKIVYPSLGYIESELFDPGRWKTKNPVVTFQYMTVADAYWAAKVVMSFTDEHIRAAVETAEYSDPAATDYLTRVLIERRDEIGRYWFAKAGGLDTFRVAQNEAGEPVLEFDDLFTSQGFALPAERVYRYRILGGGLKKIWRELSPGSPLAVPIAGEAEHGTQIVELQVRNSTRTKWSPTIAVHILQEKEQIQVLGWVRAED